MPATAAEVRITELYSVLENIRALAVAMPGETAAPRQAGTPLHTDASAASAPQLADFRGRGVDEVVEALGRSARRPNRSLAMVAKTPQTALWHVAERRAATLYRQATAAASEARADDPAVQQALARVGSGAPLAEALRREMERVLGVSLARVRVHTDAVAVEAARAVYAEAFTVGEDIYFSEGAFAPDTQRGKKLLAHELAHVAQALRGSVAPGGGDPRVSQPGDPLEREAEAVAERVVGAAPPEPRLAPASALTATTDVARDVGTTGVQPAESAPQSLAHGPRLLLRSPAPATAPGAIRIPAGGTPVNQIGVVAWDGQPALRLRGSPSTTENNVVASLPFNTRVQVIQRFTGDWLLIATLDGKMGFCSRQHIWHPPEHKLPEPNAQLHKVAGGKDGYALHIARHYYGAEADKWGADLRFYVNALGAVNHVAIPDSTDGWKTVGFKEGDYIWIPSLPFARSLHGALNSGSRSYELASAVGIGGVIERVGELLADFQEAIRLSGKYIPAAVARHVEQSVAAVLQSLLWMAVGAVALLAITTVLGAAIGALAGGAGAAPGAAAGFEVGMALLDWIGLGFLVAWIGSAVVRIGSSFGSFFAAVWTARGDKKALDHAAHVFAEAIGTLAGVCVEALVMWAISVGVKAAVGKLQGTPLGRQIGEGKLGEWLDQRIKNKKAGTSPLPGPREALRRLLELRRRGERGGEQQPKPAQPADAWSELGKRHNLDDVVTQILREVTVDPAIAERLLTKGMNQFDLGELALDFGAEGVHAVDTMVQASVQLPVARKVLQMARDMGIERQIIDMVNSKRLENLPGFRKVLREVTEELAQGSLGKYNQLMEAHERAASGNRVSIEGRRQTPDDVESGQADVVDYTQRQALQMKTVTSESTLGVVENLQSAIKQLGGDKGEHPPLGFQRIADIRIEGANNPLRFAVREQILAALRTQLTNLDFLTPQGATPGLVRITNAIATFLFTPDELR